MSDATKPILCLDFDGVIHDYKKGWQDGTIYGELTPGFLDWAHEAGKLFELVIYSSRSKSAAGVVTMAEWISAKAKAEGWHTTDLLMRDKLRLLHGKRANVIVFKFAHEKPPAFLTIDDRAVLFNGRWDQLDPDQLRGFTPWMVHGAPRFGSV